jgi:cytosine/adenosine deaminase-related metal-dependent hydrolase
MIYRAKTVVTMNGPPIEDGAVAVDEDRIAGVGKYEHLRAHFAGPVSDLGEVVLLPGLINAHCHLDFTSLRGKITPQTSFSNWIREINRFRRQLSENDYLDSIARGFDEAQRFGTTTIANIESVPALLNRMPPPSLRTWWFAELIDVRTDTPSERLIEQSLEHFRGKKDWQGGFGLSPHAPYTASQQLLQSAAQTARRKQLPVTMHLAESREEMEMFRDGRGELFELLRSLDRPMDDCGKGKTPLASMLDLGVLDSRWIVVHLNELSDDDFARLRHAPRFHVAHCPRSGRYFRHRDFALRRLLELGFNICLGSDSLASNSSLNLFAEMQLVGTSHSWLAPEKILEMATVNGARALGQKHTLGKIALDFQADLIALPIEAPAHDLFEKIVGWNGTVPWMMLAGARVAAS